jgi:TRAP-type C4-dicarboxylate transport system permease small subunit
VRGKKICLGAGHLLMLFVCYLVLQGAYSQVQVNLESTSAAMEASLAIFYVSAAVFAVLGGLILAYDFARLLTGRLSDAELVGVRESEERAHESSPTR